MATPSRSEEKQPAREAAVQQPALGQTQSAATTQADDDVFVRPETLLQQTDLTSPNETEDDMPPPPDGEIYGEIRQEKYGLGTSARVTDDGRVNIRINQINDRVSQIFTPALGYQMQAVEDSQPPPSPYIPPSLGGDKKAPPPPPLDVLIQVVGSREDVQPFVSLGKVLKETYGHRVRLATHPNLNEFVKDNGLEFFSIGGDPSQLMTLKNPSLLRGDIGQQRQDVAQVLQGCWRSCYERGNGMVPGSTSRLDLDIGPGPFVADCIIANPSSLAHIHCAEKLGIPLHIMSTMPNYSTAAFPHPLANIQSSNTDPQLTNYMSYTMIDVLSLQVLGDVINQFRTELLGLDAISLTLAPEMLNRLKVPHTYFLSSALMPKPKDWGPQTSISGFPFLNSASKYDPAPDLLAFLDAGPPPVYIGFDNIVLENPDGMTELIFEAAAKSGQRVLLSKGWGGVDADRLDVPDDIFMLGDVPHDHDWLFKQVSCVVHHGGADTTARGIAVGRPTVVVTFFGDQPFWGAMVARVGAGPNPLPHKQLTADKLADAISFCLKPESVKRARELANKIAPERGSDTAAQSFHQHIEVDQFRCTLTPSRAAVWRIKRTNVRLSAFAACTLENAKLLDIDDLELCRPREYAINKGPWDTTSCGAAVCYWAFSGMAMGEAEVPSETSTSLNTNSSVQNIRPNLSNLPSSSSEVGSNSMPAESQSHSSSKEHDVHQSRPRSRNDTRPGNDFKSGDELAEAAAKVLRGALHDGESDLVTQPWKFAQNGIVSSKLSRGYVEWLWASDAEKQGIIAQWNIVQKGIKEKRDVDALTPDPGSASVSHVPEQSVATAVLNEHIRTGIRKTLLRTDDFADAERFFEKIDDARAQHLPQEASGHRVHEENLRRAMASGDLEAQQEAAEALEYEDLVRKTMAASLRE